MTIDTPTPARPRSIAWWLAPAGAFTLVAIGILWAIPKPTSVCIAIYPPPPECAVGDPSTVLPFLVLLALLYAGLVASALLVPTRRRALVLGLLCGAIGLVALVGLAVTLAAATPSPLPY